MKKQQVSTPYDYPPKMVELDDMWKPPHTTRPMVERFKSKEVLIWLDKARPITPADRMFGIQAIEGVIIEPREMAGERVDFRPHPQIEEQMGFLIRFYGRCEGSLQVVPDYCKVPVRYTLLTDRPDEEMKIIAGYAEEIYAGSKRKLYLRASLAESECDDLSLRVLDFKLFWDPDVAPEVLSEKRKKRVDETDERLLLRGEETEIRCTIHGIHWRNYYGCPLGYSLKGTILSPARLAGLPVFVEAERIEDQRDSETAPAGRVCRLYNPKTLGGYLGIYLHLHFGELWKFRKHVMAIEGRRPRRSEVVVTLYEFDPYGSDIFIEKVAFDWLKDEKDKNSLSSLESGV